MSVVQPTVRLSRAALRASGCPADAPPPRIAHFGVGAFARAHQAWYTARASDHEHWGIVGFTGRTREMADRLCAQDGLYTLVQRGATGDEFEIVPNLVAVHPGSEPVPLTATFADPDLAVVTLTITESAYRFADGTRESGLDRVVEADVALLRRGDPELPTTALGRLLFALETRRRSRLAVPAIVPCDNMPDNGGVLRRALVGLADRVSADLASWLDDSGAFVSTSVDRITPRLGPGERAQIAKATGWDDAAPVVTEIFSDWTLSGGFALGRPDWASAGARFVDDLRPFESRKLWMLNGAHTLLATLGRLRGHRTVADAIADPACWAAVDRYWDDVEPNLPGELGHARFRSTLAERFANPRIEHPLEQIATDTLTKLRVRIAPVAELELSAGRRAAGSALAIAAWIATVDVGVASHDSHAGLIARAGSEAAPHHALLRLVNPVLADDPAFSREVDTMARDLIRHRA